MQRQRPTNPVKTFSDHFNPRIGRARSTSLLQVFKSGRADMCGTPSYASSQLLLGPGGKPGAAGAEHTGKAKTVGDAGDAKGIQSPSLLAMEVKRTCFQAKGTRYTSTQALQSSDKRSHVQPSCPRSTFAGALPEVFPERRDHGGPADEESATSQLSETMRSLAVSEPLTATHLQFGNYPKQKACTAATETWWNVICNSGKPPHRPRVEGFLMAGIDTDMI